MKCELVGARKTDSKTNINKYHTIGTVPTFNRKIVEMKWKTKKYPNVENT
jgi:hypothetical protein